MHCGPTLVRVGSVKFGVIPPYGIAPVEEPEFALAFAQLAEEFGFESIWVVEHVVMAVEYTSVYPYDPSGRSPFHARVSQPDPLIWLSHVAAATKRIRLATGILNLPQRNPVILAKEIASLDRLSGGRVELGIGIGWVREEAEAVGSDFATRGRRAEEYVAAMRALWQQEVATFEGEFVRFSGVVCEPRPAQAGGVPIIVGGHSKAAARRAGRFGDGFYPLGVTGERLAELQRIADREARASGRDPRQLELTLLGSADLESAHRCRESGAKRMVIGAPASDLAGLRESFERFQNEVVTRI